MREGPHTENGREEASKVVRLPRDWLGPRDLLVPFGSPATSEPDPLEAAPPPVRAVPSPDAFWGEDSAAIHDAVAGPASFGEAVPAPSGSDARRSRLDNWRPHRRLAAGAGIAVAAALALVTAVEVVIEHPGAENLSARIHHIRTSNHPAQVSQVTTAMLANRAARERPTPRPHHAASAHHTARAGASVQSARHHLSDSGSGSSHPTQIVPASNPAPAQSAVTYTHSSPSPHYTSSTSAGVHSGSGSGSASPSKATLRSLVTGAGTCSCQ